MRITLLTVGSRGDVQPTAALAVALQASGHDTVVGASPDYEDLIVQRGLVFKPLAGDVMSILASARGQAWTESGGNFFRSLRMMRKILEPMADQLLADAQEACRGADAILYTPLTPAGSHIAEAARVPGVVTSIIPLAPTREFPAVTMGGLPSLGRVYNRMTYRLLTAATLLFRSVTNRWRSSLDLPPLGWRNPYGALADPEQPMLYAYSDRVVPRPRDWNDSQHVTGYWILDRPPDWQPPASLERFLSAGEPPVVVAFGSMMVNGRDIAELVLDRVERHGYRAVFVGPGCGEQAARAGRSRDAVYAIDDVPYEWLFPRAQAVVHHGGAGTTGAALRAGVPSLVVPFFLDQPFWARRLAGLGVAARPIPRKQATAERLDPAIRLVTADAGMRERARRLGPGLRSEDGAGAAVATLDRLLNQARVAP